MEPFSVTCETCRARLKVRDPRIIGEVHACPKCDSMVHILPPAGHGIAAAAPVVATQSTTASASIEFPVDVSRFEDGIAEAVAETTTVPVAAATDAAPASSVEIPAPVATNFSPWVMWGAGAAALVVIGGVVGAWLSSGGEADVSPIAKMPVVAVEQPKVEAPKPAAEQVSTPPADVKVEPTVAEPATAEAALPGKPEAETVAEAPATIEEPAAALKQSQAAIAERPIEQAVAKVPVEAASSVDAPAAAASEPAPVLKFDPLDFDPARVALNSGPAANSEKTTKSIAAAETTEVVVPPEVPEASAAAPPDAEKLAVKPTLTSRLGPAVGGNAQSEDVLGRLAVPVGAFEVREMPLSEFVETVSNAANIPITIDPFELALAGASAQQPISVKAENATLDVVAKDALAKRRLAIEERDGQLVVVLADGGRDRPIDYDLSDLSNDGGMAAVNAMITRFVAPETWETAGGTGKASLQGGKLHVEQSQRVQHEILIFCERLRLARGLQPRTRYPRELLEQNSGDERVGLLQERATFTFLPWTPFKDVAEYWQDKSGLTVLVDWQAMAKAGFWPASPVSCSAVGRTWEDVFDGALEPLGLAWAPVDDKTIQITTRDGLDQQRRIEFYAVSPKWRGQFASVATLVKSVENELQQYGAGAPGKPRLAIAFDEPSGQLIVLGSPAAHRHLAGWLHNQATL